jgi:hypothetical protein
MTLTQRLTASFVSMGLRSNAYENRAWNMARTCYVLNIRQHVTRAEIERENQHRRFYKILAFEAME